MEKYRIFKYAPQVIPRLAQLSVKKIWNHAKKFEIIAKSFPNYKNQNELPCK